MANIFVPIAVEIYGAWGPEVKTFVAELGRQIAGTMGEPRSSTFLRQRINVALQRENAASVLGTMHAQYLDGT